MNSGKYIFAQLLSLIDHNEFNRCVDRYNGNYRYRDFNSWNHFAQLLFGQITSLKSLRDICLCLNAHKPKLYHLGIKQSVNQSTLSRANERRDWRIFADYAYYLISIVRPMYSSADVPNLEIRNTILALDSTTISLSIKLATWAEGKYSRGAVKAHTLLDLRGGIPVFIHITDGKWHDSNALDMIAFEQGVIYVMDRAYFDLVALYRIEQAGAFFVTRPRTPFSYIVNSSAIEIEEAKGIRSDDGVMLKGPKSRKLYPIAMRRIEYWDDEKQESLVFITNNFDLSAVEIAALYRNRWQIEVFFKWIKQNLTIKHLWGYSENAVHIHIWVAICAYLLVAYLKALFASPLSVYEIMQILSVSALDKTPVAELLTKTESISKQNIKEQMSLFDEI
ncbi:MAG: IS4 family transposase [Rikenellaceae bacterium]